MLTNHPPCANCGEVDLYRLIGVDLRYRCQNCGWDSGVIVEREGLTKAELIAAAVQEARAVIAARGT